MNDEKKMNFENVAAALDFAIDKEQEAFDFYMEWSAKLEHDAIRQVFREFAVEELRHRDLITDVKEGKRDLKVDENVRDLKITDYFVEVEASAQMNYQDALQFAIQREKGSIELYRQLVDRATSNNIYILFESLVQEETKHKMRLEEIYDDNFLKEG
jgi:rubrerythrin